MPLSILVISIPLPTSNLQAFEEFVSPKGGALEDWDHYTFLGNCPCYPSPKPTLTLTPHLGQNVGLGEG